MLEKQFEDFLVDQLIDWCSENLTAGFRYQFKSPDYKNSQLLHAALLKRAAGAFYDDETKLSYLVLNQVRLVPVLHGVTTEGAFTENYISRLRDSVSAQQDVFQSSALLVIHNSMLDTLINSADDLEQSGQVWHPASVKEKLKRLINPFDKNRHVSENLLELIYRQVLDDGGTVFGFRNLYNAIVDGDLRFAELGLLNDPDLFRFDDARQIQSRLDENKRLHDRINEVTERFPNELVEKLSELDLGESFVERHFSDPGAWKEQLDFSSCIQEQLKNRAAGLKFESEEGLSGSQLIARDKSATKAGKRERHVILCLSEHTFVGEFELTFVGGSIEKSDVVIKDTPEPHLLSFSINNAGGKRSRVRVKREDVTTPCYFSIRIQREKVAECYTFNILILPPSDFLVDEVAYNFLVVPKRQQLLLQTDENRLKISDLDSESQLEVVGQVFETCSTGSVNFDAMASESAELVFIVKTNNFSLQFAVEGAVASEALTLPLLLDVDRYTRLFDPDFYGIFNRARNKIIIDNQEVAPKARRLTLLQWEHQLVTEHLLYRHDDAERNVSLDALSEYPSLRSAYQAMFQELQKRKSLPSLSSWDMLYQQLVKAVVTEFTAAIAQCEYNNLLTKQQKQLMQLGFAVFDGNEFITPLHPLVLAYNLYLSEQLVADKAANQSFAQLPKVTRERLHAQGLVPFVFHPKFDFSYVQVERDNSFWMRLVPQQQSSFSFVRKLVTEKIGEFQAAFSMLFSCGPKAKLLINSVNNRDNYDLFLGLVDLVKILREKVPYIHVCLYDDQLEYNEFDRFADLGKHDEIKKRYELDKGKAKDYADLVVDLLRSRLTYSKYENSKVAEQQYAHISFFRNNQRVERTDVDPDQEISGVLCKGLIAGEAAANKQGSYFTAFGLRGVDVRELPHLVMAQQYNRLLKPAFKTNEQHGAAKSTALAVSDNFRSLLERSYDKSIWTCIIDPKVTLDFFETSKDVVLIHYSDNYTNSTNYDAITVTKQTDLYRKVLERDEKGGHIEEFNAFNGEWLLKMITDSESERKAKRGVIGAYKYVNCLLSKSDITWVPLSVAEMIRVARNIGLKISESDFSRDVQGYKQGAISDDVLFAGFKDKQMYLLPVEVKTGKRQTHTKGFQQVKELKRYLTEDLLGKKDLAGMLYRGLFARQVLMQVEKYKLYNLYHSEYFDQLVERREWWLKGEYELGTLHDYPEGFLVANVEDATFFDANFEEEQDVLKIELPIAVLGELIRQPLSLMLENASRETLFYIPEQYLLKPQSSGASLQAVNEPGESKSELPAPAETSGRLPTLSSEKSNQQESVQPSPLQVLFGHDARNDKPLFWEPTNTARFMNTNTGIIGTMGTGKTQFTKSLITQLHRNQHNNVNSAPIGVLIFDYKSDYVDDDFIAATQAKKYKLFKLPYNPLSLFGDTPMLPIHTAAGFSETMAKAYGLGPKQQLRLENLILEAYSAAGISSEDPSTWRRPAPTIEDVWNLFMAQEKVEEDSLYAALSKLARFKIFESVPEKMTSLYELTDGVTVIELAGYPTEIKNLVVALTLDLFYSQMQKRGKPAVQGDYRQITKMILVDEADNFMSQNFSSLRKILKEGREYGVGLVLSTQDITHFKNSENNYAAYILTWVIHRVSEIRSTDIKAIFNIEDKGEQENLMETIRRLEKHFSLYVDGEKRVSKMRDRAFWELGV